MKITFSINTYDADGDLVDEGIFLHFERTTIMVASNIVEFKRVVFQIEVIAKEIEGITR